PNADIDEVVIIEPCFIAEGAIVRNSVIGPHVSIGAKSHISNSVIVNSIIQDNSRLDNQLIENSMIGNHVQLLGKAKNLSLGDFNQLED
ncbi:MAG: hypothetical protein K8F24_13320, partial [Bacteroidales bacterium]|nr:hypothetical protein [Bacteroidales bacterium]